MALKRCYALAAASLAVSLVTSGAFTFKGKGWIDERNARVWTFFFLFDILKFRVLPSMVAALAKMQHSC